MSDILKQIQALQEQFSNLFEVEGLGNPAVDVPPSQNKIKKDVKTKDGKAELVSVEDELFPYDGNKREQYRQKILDTINGMIQGTSTLEDLLQIVRQKRAPLKEAMELVEAIINEGRKEGESQKDFKHRLHGELVRAIDKKAAEARDKSIEASKKYYETGKGRAEAIKASEKAKKEHDKLGKLDDIEPVANAYMTVEPLKEAIELMEAIINEVSDKTAQGALDAAQQRYNRKGYEASMKLFRGDSKGAIEDGNKAQDEYNKHLGLQLKRAKRLGKKLVQDKNDHDSFKIEEALEIMEDLINMIDKAEKVGLNIKGKKAKVQNAREKEINQAAEREGTSPLKIKGRRLSNDDIVKAQQKYQKADKGSKIVRGELEVVGHDFEDKPVYMYKAPLKEAMEVIESIHDAIAKYKMGAQFYHDKALKNSTEEIKAAAKRNLPKEKQNSFKALNNEMNKIYNKRQEGEHSNRRIPVEEALEIMEAIINEVSIGKWKEAAASSLPKRQEEAEAAKAAAEKGWEEYDKVSREHPEDEPALYRLALANDEEAAKAEDKADHAYAVTRLQTHDKANANKAIKTAKKVQDKREDEFGRNPEKRTFLRSGKANQLAAADPVKSRADEALEEALAIISEVSKEFLKDKDDKAKVKVLKAIIRHGETMTPENPEGDPELLKIRQDSIDRLKKYREKCKDYLEKKEKRNDK